MVKIVNVNEAFTFVAPYYNLTFVLIVLFLFILLFKTSARKKLYLQPWKLLFAGLIIFVLEEVLTILRALKWLLIPVHVNGFFEFLIIALFVYALTLQNKHVRG
ncbi:hypothetical protein HYV79_03075 [Candidatus Woesearchaeota archaeon]|nr:hypothetical protein [Candidatus Woesearchaeota archaeon]